MSQIRKLTEAECIALHEPSFGTKHPKLAVAIIVAYMLFGAIPGVLIALGWVK